MMTQETEKVRKQMQIVCIDDLVPQDHLLRLIDKAIEWLSIYDLVRDTYSDGMGRPSIDPVTAYQDSSYSVSVRNKEYAPNHQRD